MPVLPLVGSMSTVLPGVILPLLSASSIMAKPMRSLTLDAGFWLSSLTTTEAGSPAARRFNRTNGVRPINSVTFAAMRAMMISFFWGHGPGPVKISGIGAVSWVRKSSALQAHVSVAAGTRTALATSTHTNTLDPTPRPLQALERFCNDYEAFLVSFKVAFYWGKS